MKGEGGTCRPLNAYYDKAFSIVVVVMASGVQTFVGVWYPDDPEQYSAMEILKSSTDVEFCAILHDKDIADDGSFKKPHWHLVIRFPFQKSVSAAAKTLGVPENYIRACTNYKGALRYLIHLDDPDKAQYSSSEVFGSLTYKVPLRKEESSISEGERVAILLDLIDQLPVPCTVGRMVRSIAAAGYYGELRRGGTFFLRILDEHNSCSAECVKFSSYEDSVRRTNFRSFVEGYEACNKDLKVR